MLGAWLGEILGKRIGQASQSTGQSLIPKRPIDVVLSQNASRSAGGGQLFGSVFPLQTLVVVVDEVTVVEVTVEDVMEVEVRMVVVEVNVVYICAVVGE